MAVFLLRIAHLKILLALLLSGAALLARAEEIEVREVRLAATEEGLALSAAFAFDFNPRLAEAVANGIPLYFAVEFELTRTRWWWFDNKVAVKRMQLRLSYHALSRHYRLSTGLLQQNFSTLEEALAVLRRVRSWIVVDRAVPLAEGTYEAAVRMRLDATLLPKPFQLSAITSRELTLESPWRRFAYRAPAAPEPRDMKDAKDGGEADTR
ncbi:MAG: DUF4390 domain-containing protein [Betaproteobacteria bacterium]|nr:DUF4390 domain-containing protein [Betaproteobacteria bacterium]